MKIALIIVSIQSSLKQAKQLKKEFRKNIKDLQVFVVKNKEGKEGYAVGVNKGLRKASKSNADIFIVANPDLTELRLNKKWLLEGVERYDVWGYGFKQGKNSYYGGIIDKNRLTGGFNPHRMWRKKMDFVSGSLICFTRKTFKSVGYWNENYHMYYEDVEFCQRALKKGLRVGVVNKVVYRHLESSQSSNSKDLLLMKSWLRYFVLHAKPRNWIYEIARLPKTVYEYRTLLFAEVKKRPFIYNFLTLNFSSLIIKILNFVLFLFLVRYFSAQEFGLYNLVWAQITLFMPLADLGTTNYGIFHLKKTEKNAFSRLFSLRLWLGAIFVFVTLGYTHLIFQQKELLFLTFLSSPVVLANAVSGSFLIYTTLNAKAYLASAYSLVFNTILIGVLIGLVASNFGLRALFLAEGLWFGIYALYLWIKTREVIRLKIQIPKLSYVKAIVQRSFRYVLLSFFAGLYFKIDLLIIQNLKGLQEVGIYSAGYKFFEALIFLGASYTIAATPVFKQHLAENIYAVKKKIRRDSVLLFGLGLGVAVLSWPLAPIILPFALGAEFIEGVNVFRVVIFALPFLLVSAVCMNVLYLLKKTQWVVMIFLLQIVVNSVLNIIFVPLFSYQASAIITVLCEVLNTVIVVPLVVHAYENIG